MTVAVAAVQSRPSATIESRSSFSFTCAGAAARWSSVSVSLRLPSSARTWREPIVVVDVIGAL